MRLHPAATAREVAGIADALAEVLAASGAVEYAFGHGSFFEGLPYHDVDIAVRGEPGALGDHRVVHVLATRCERAVGRPVDLHGMEGTGFGFRRAATSGRLIWARDPEAALQYAELLRRMAWDWRPLQDQIVRDL